MSKEKNKQRKHTSKNTKPKNVYAKDEDRDRHLQAPTEANRDEHINFTALERGEQDPADEREKIKMILLNRTQNLRMYMQRMKIVIVICSRQQKQIAISI